MSAAITVNRRASGWTLRIQWLQAPWPPCSSTSTGPLPQLRHVMVPSPQGVRSVRAAPATAATCSAGLRPSFPLIGLTESRRPIRSSRISAADARQADRDGQAAVRAVLGDHLALERLGVAAHQPQPDAEMPT